MGFGKEIEPTSTITLKYFLSKAPVGEFVVTKIGKTLTLVRVASNQGGYLLLEEISFAEKMLPELEGKWDLWLKNKAPQHLSWNLIEIDLNNSAISEMYSITQNKHLKISLQESPIASLLDQPLSKIPNQNRRKIGPQPSDGEIDTRKIWTPPYIFEGKKVQDCSIEAHRATWPKDMSALSDRPITLYFDSKNQIHFPLWIDAETTHVIGKIQILDSGQNLTSGYKKIPKRAMQIKSIENSQQELRVTCTCPRYFNDFYLIASYNSDGEQQVIPIEEFFIDQTGETVIIQIPKSQLPTSIDLSSTQITIAPIGFDHIYSTSGFISAPRHKN